MPNDFKVNCGPSINRNTKDRTIKGSKLVFKELLIDCASIGSKMNWPLVEFHKTNVLYLLLSFWHEVWLAVGHNTAQTSD